jgi:hypothetical protein
MSARMDGRCTRAIQSTIEGDDLIPLRRDRETRRGSSWRSSKDRRSQSEEHDDDALFDSNAPILNKTITTNVGRTASGGGRVSIRRIIRYPPTPEKDEENDMAISIVSDHEAVAWAARSAKLTTTKAS